MLPQNAGAPARDWMQILIALVWLTVLCIMLLAKMKAIQDVIVLAFLLIATGVQNLEMIIPSLTADKRYERNFNALRKHLRWECFWCFVLALMSFEIVQISRTGLDVRLLWDASGSNSSSTTSSSATDATTDSSSTIPHVFYFGWLYQMLTSVCHFLSRNRQFHLNPIVSLAEYHGSSVEQRVSTDSVVARMATEGKAGGAAVDSTGEIVVRRSVMTEIQLHLYVALQLCGVVMGALLHIGRRSRRDDEMSKILQPLLEITWLPVVELLIASLVNYGIVRTVCWQKTRAKQVKAA